MTASGWTGVLRWFVHQRQGRADPGPWSPRARSGNGEVRPEAEVSLFRPRPLGPVLSRAVELDDGGVQAEIAPRNFLASLS